MALRIYDTLTREKRVFEPIDPTRVRMYVCGPTVYDLAHIGNARPPIVFDVLFRLLRHVYGPEHVVYARNITDVDDKINARAALRGIQIGELTSKTAADYQADMAALGCLPPTVEPRATEHIAQMRAVIERIVAAGHAYVADDHVLFDVPSMPDYGRLSNRALDDMIAGARVEVEDYKRDAMDFVLWKPSKAGEPSWPSPCGIAAPGRPGWHIECSAMAWEHLGKTFDIHGGGIDLVFPHHENEIAQSRCAFYTGVMANYWMHNGHLQFEGEKMSKSAGTVITVRESLGSWPGEVLRLNMLRTHYRQPMDWTQAGLSETAGIYANLRRDVAAADRNKLDPSRVSPKILAALEEDLNTPAAITELYQLANGARAGTGTSTEAADALMNALAFLGFDRAIEHVRPRTSPQDIQGASGEVRDPVRDFQKILAREKNLDPEQLDQLTAARTAARKAKNFPESDRIRDELARMGVAVKDSKDGSTWEIPS